jgi:ABC-2 type transport system permease protein
MDKYLTIFRFSFIHALRNTKTLIGLSIFLITCLIIFAHLWQVAAARLGAVHLHPDQLVWYIAFNQWLLIAVPDTHEEIEEDLRSGKLAYLLPRPISYLWATFLEGLGTLSARLVVLGLVTFLFTWIRAGDIPFGWDAFLMATLIGFLAGAIAVLFRMCIGLSAFWVRQVEPLHWIWDKSLFTLGGLMLPLIAYPDWLRKIARLTPFPAILGDRSALAIHFTWEGACSVITTLLLWGIIGTSLLVLLYQRGLRIVNIEGG